MTPTDYQISRATQYTDALFDYRFEAIMPIKDRYPAIIDVRYNKDLGIVVQAKGFDLTQSHIIDIPWPLVRDLVNYHIAHRVN